MFHCSRFNSYFVLMADFIAIVADGIATNYYKWYDSVEYGIATSMLADIFAKYMMADVIATCGRWNGHMFLIRLMLLPLWQMEWPHGWNVSRQILLPWWQMGQATGSIYFNFSSLLLIRTSSHIWGRWYLPMLLFKDGLLTLTNIDSLISLERFCSSLPTMLKFSSEVVWPVVLLWS